MLWTSFGQTVSIVFLSSDKFHETASPDTPTLADDEKCGGKYTESILWNFNGTDGDQPDGGLILDGAGNLYGTTFKGGTSGRDAPGTVFEVTP